MTALLAVLALSSPLALSTQQEIVKKCEAATPPPRPEDNQPIPEQLKIPNAPKTARQVDCYTSFPKSSTMLDVVRKCGIPDKHIGSGVYIFVYYMNDCSKVFMSTPDLQQHLTIGHVKQGKRTELLNTW